MQESKGIVNPIVVEHRVKHEAIGFGGKEEVTICDSSLQSLAQAKTTKIIFFKVGGTKENVMSIEEKSKKRSGQQTITPIHL
jgi:hypothetical protein